jgi:ankyrin repeat protein
MNNEKFRQMITEPDIPGLKIALASDHKLANQGIKWYLNQNNESDPLHYVCDCVFNGWLEEDLATEIAVLLIENGALIEGSKGKESPLIAATSLGCESVAKLLIDSGANLEATGVFGARPLHWAASMGLSLTVELLIHKGSELEKKCSEFGATPLYWAVFSFGPHGPNRKRDPIESVKMLLEAGANLDTTNNQGISALKCSQQADATEMNELLMKYSNDPDEIL